MKENKTYRRSATMHVSLFGIPILKINHLGSNKDNCYCWELTRPCRVFADRFNSPSFWRPSLPNHCSARDFFVSQFFFQSYWSRGCSKIYWTQRNLFSLVEKDTSECCRKKRKAWLFHSKNIATRTDVEANSSFNQLYSPSDWSWKQERLQMQ